MTNFDPATSNDQPNAVDGTAPEPEPRGASTGTKAAAAAIALATTAGIAIAALVFFRPGATGNDVENQRFVETPPESLASADEPEGNAAADRPSSGIPVDSDAESDGDRQFGVADGDDLIGSSDSSDDFLGGDQETEDAIFDGIDQGPALDPIAPDPVTPGLGRLCPSVVHGQSDSGIWVRGSVYGLDDGWIFVESPTVNSGEPVQVPITDGLFDSPLPIAQYGNHEMTRFELGSDEFPDGIDLRPTLAQGPGTSFPVGPDEGPIFDQECFDFSQPTVELTDEEIDGAPVPADIDEGVDAELFVEGFLDGFVDAHRTGDVGALQASLHPAIRLAFGDDVCTAYIGRTAGSIASATMLSVGEFQQLDMDTPTGPITFLEAVPFTVEFTLVDGSTVVNEAHLPMHDGEPHWLTTCGVEAN